MATTGKADVSKAMNAPKVRAQNYEVTADRVVKVEGAISPLSESGPIAAKSKSAPKTKRRAVKMKSAGKKAATKTAAKKKVKKKGKKKTKR